MTDQYICKDNSGGYQDTLTVGKIYTGKRVEGIFTNWPYLEVLEDDQGKSISGYLSRFTKME